MAHDQIDKLMCICVDAGDIRDGGQVVSHPRHLYFQVRSGISFQSLTYHQIAKGGEQKQQRCAHQPNF